MTNFEKKRFKPGTPANDFYQVIMDRGWQGQIITNFVFPRKDLPYLSAKLRSHGFSLVEGVPTMFRGPADAPDQYNVKNVVHSCLDIEPDDDKIYTFGYLGLDGKDIRPGAPASLFTSFGAAKAGAE